MEITGFQEFYKTITDVLQIEYYRVIYSTAEGLCDTFEWAMSPTFSNQNVWKKTTIDMNRRIDNTPL